MEAPFFSVIMPVYKTETYLPEAIDSVLGQTFSNFELILVDDCSPDKSGAICDAYAQKDSRVRVLHQPENGGASAAREKGLSYARGKYVLFMDSDDTLSETIMSASHTALVQYQPQVLMFGAQEVYVNAKGDVYSRKDILYPACNLQSHTQVRKEVITIEKTTLFGYLWNKFYALDFLQSAGVTFADMPLNEDFQYNLELFRTVSSLFVLEQVGYYYYKRQSLSLTGRFVENYFDLQRLRIQSLYEFYEAENACTDTVKTVLGNIYMRSVLSALERNCDPRAKMDHKARKAWLQTQSQDAFFWGLLAYASPEGKLASFFCTLLRKKKFCMLLACARGMFFVKSNMPTLFARVKQSR